MDTNLPVQSPNESIWEKFTGRHLALGEQLAKQSKERNDLGAMFANARTYGLSPTDQDRMEQEGRLKELTAQFVESTKDLDDTQYQEAAKRFALANGAPHPERQVAQLEQPNLAQSGFALLAAFLDPQNAAQSAAQPFIAQTQQRDRQQGLNDQAYADQTRKRSADIDAAGTQYQIEERKLGKAQSAQDRQSNMIRMQMSDVEKRIGQLDTKQQAALNQAYSMYNGANTPDEKRVAGRRLQSMLGDSGLAPTDEEIMSAVQGLEAENDRYANQEWEKALTSELNAFGEVDEARGVQLESQRQAIAKRYGIPPENLRAIPTAKTLRAQAHALAMEKFSFLKTKTKSDFAIKWANYQVSKQRAATYATAVANGLTLGMGRNQIASGNLQMRAFEAAGKDMLGGASAQFKEVLRDINTLSANPTEENNKKLANKRAELNQLAMEVANELGIDPAELLKNPLKVTDTILKEIEEEEANRQAELEGLAPFMKGEIDPTTKGVQSTTKTKPRPRKPRPRGNAVSEAKRRGFIVD